MKMAIVLGLLLLLEILFAAETTARTLYEDSMVQKHEQWMNFHGRVYKDSAEKEERFKIFMENVKFIEAFNKNESNSYKLGINAFSDLTDDEIRAARFYNKKLYMQNLSFHGTTSFKYKYVTNVPPHVDWRTKGAVTPIKNQGSFCGKSFYIYP